MWAWLISLMDTLQCVYVHFRHPLPPVFPVSHSRSTMSEVFRNHSHATNWQHYTKQTDQHYHTRAGRAKIPRLEGKDMCCCLQTLVQELIVEMTSELLKGMRRWDGKITPERRQELRQGPRNTWTLKGYHNRKRVSTSRSLVIQWIFLAPQL